MWFSNVYKSSLITSSILFMIYLFTSGRTSIGALISGYVLLIITVSLLLTALFYNILRVSNNPNNIKTVFTVFMNTGPFILMLAVISFMLYLLLTYKNNIIEQHVSAGFNTFSIISVILLFCQIYVVYSNMMDPQFEKVGKLPQITNSLLYLYGILSGMCSLILFTILRYYTTDG